MRIEVADLPAMRLAGLWHRGPFERIRETFALLFPRLEVLGLGQLPGSPLVAAYYDDPVVTPADELRSFAGVKIAEDTVPGDLSEVQLLGGRFLWAEFTGPHDHIPDAWSELAARVAEGPYESRVADAKGFEVYVGAEAGSDQDRTDLYWPVA